MSSGESGDLNRVFNFKLTIAYDGTRYHGWQIQPGVPTIQGEVNQALGRILDQPVTTHGSGRTDRGVHADGQVAHVTLEHDIQPATLVAGSNALLPPDIRILTVERVPPEFHARLWALAKTYQYNVWRTSVVNPFRYRYVCPVRQSLDAHAMDRATERFVGTHDFSSFCAKATETDNRVRTVYEAGWTHGSEEWVFTIRANGFLRYMVRSIVGTLLAIGQGRTRWQEIDAMFLAADRALAGPSAPAAGLRLLRVEYPEPNPVPVIGSLAPMGFGR